MQGVVIFNSTVCVACCAFLLSLNHCQTSPSVTKKHSQLQPELQLAEQHISKLDPDSLADNCASNRAKQALACYLLARLKLKQNKTKAAQNILIESLSLKNSQSDKNALFFQHRLLGHIYLRQGQCSFSVWHTRQALAIKANEPYALTQLAYCLEAQAKSSAAFQLYRQALSRAGENLKGHILYLLASNRLHIRDLKTAKNYAIQASRLRPDNSEYKCLLTEIVAVADIQSIALTELSNCYQLDNKHRKRAYLYALALIQSGRNQKAIAIAAQMRVNGYLLASAKIEMLASFKLHQYRKTLQAIAELRQMISGSLDLDYYEALSHAHLAQHKQAIIFYKRVAVQNPAYPQLWWNLAASYREMGNLGDMRQALKQGCQQGDSLCCQAARNEKAD